MKKQFKIFYCYIILSAFSLFITGCGGRSVAHADIDGTLDELFAKIYEGASVESPFTETRELADDNLEYYIGTSDVIFSEGAASEALITTVPHSIVLLRTQPNADIESIKKKIKDNVNPYKWICVGVDESNVVVDNIGNLVILIMDKNSAAYHESFLKLAE